MSASALEIGSVFAGRYKVVRRLAAGAMGAVYEVVHLETQRRRALKVMLPHIVESVELRDRFKLEARIAGHIESKFIVDVFDAGVDDATEMPFLVMELLRGEELGKRLKRVGRFSSEEVVQYLHETALALDRTHKASIVHRDLKPGNLFLSEREDEVPHIKVLDFGVAKLVAEVGTNAGSTMTVGTPLYMSPEQFRSGKITGAADIYALGMMAYTFLVGQAYWAEEMKQGGNVVAFAMIAVYGPQEPASVRAARKGVPLPSAFDAWFAKATSPHPEVRFATATMAVSALAEVLGRSPVGGLAPSARGTLPSVILSNSIAEIAVAPEASATMGQGSTSLSSAATNVLRKRTPSPAIPVALAATVVLLGVVAVVLLRNGPLSSASVDTPKAAAALSTAAPLPSVMNSAAVDVTAAPSPGGTLAALSVQPAASSKPEVKSAPSSSARVASPKVGAPPPIGSPNGPPPASRLYVRD